MGCQTLDRLRRAGLTVEATDGGLRVTPRERLTQELREALVDQRREIRAQLLREAAERELDPVPVDPGTGRPKLSARTPAAPDQAARLRELATAPELPENAPDVVERALENSLTEAGAYELIGRLGGAIAEAGRKTSLGPSRAGGGGTCKDCGRDIGPTSTRCGGCKRTSRGPRDPGGL